jgi:hypothetical protein
VKVGIWCAVNARRIVVPVFFYETVNCERYIQIILGHISPELTEEEMLWPVSLGTELSVVVFGQHVHLILILEKFPSAVV